MVMKTITKKRTLTIEEVEEILKYCGRCAKLDLQKLTCFARTVLYFKNGQKGCKAEEYNIRVWEDQLKQMLKYASKKGHLTAPSVKKELERVQKGYLFSLNSDIKKVYWDEVNRKDRKFGGGEKREAAVSIKQKMKDNRLVIGYDERRREEAKMLRLSTKTRRKKI